MRQLSLADRGQTVSLDKAIDDVAPTCMGVARLGSLQTAGTSFSVWMQVRGTSWVEVFEVTTGRLFYTSPPENDTFSWTSARDLKLRNTEIRLPKR